VKTAIATILLATGCAYDAGSFRSIQAPFTGTKVTIGCLDMSLGYGADSFARGKLAEISFGNRCEHRIALDFVNMPAVAHGVRVPVWDPRRELEIAELPARMVGTETFEYRDAAPEEQLCLDVGGVNREEPRTSKWVCL
jgi:hypothetical protein